MIGKGLCRRGVAVVPWLCLVACSSAAPAPRTAAPPPQAPPAAATVAPAPAGEIFRLPAGVRPTRQQVELEVVPERETFSGHVEIAVVVDQPRDDLYISARDLTLDGGHLVAGGTTIALTFEPDQARGATRLVAAARIPAGPATLSLDFHAAFHPRLVGLYRVKSQGRWYAFTQLEAVDARRAFPCFDEPAYKIPWDIVLRVPREAVAVSNAPAQGETLTGDLKRVAFKTTRPLPSYLVALAVGDFDVVTPPPLPPNEIRKRPLQVRGLAPRGRGGELAWSLRAGGELLVMLERWFGSEFPYEKLDHVAVPDFEYGAMENAGLITYRESALLVDPARASEDQKLVVAVDLAHEMAHQWFGDLVTMSWWDDLWLNESFASFMETEMVQAWAKGNRYDLDQLNFAHDAMNSDELSTVSPIRPEVRTESNIFGFDYAITYPKGARVIGMFEQFLGPDVFRRGLRAYLAAHADGNATMDDLLGSLGAAGGTDVRAAMTSFVLQPGVPLVRGELRCDGGRPRVALTQSRQLPVGSPASAEVTWQVPVCVRSDGGGPPDCMLLATASAELPLRRTTCPTWIILNPDGRGYYRWALPPDGLRALLDHGMDALTPAERLSLGSNLSAGFRSGSINAADAMAALAPLARDPEPSVAQAPINLLDFARRHVVDAADRPAVEARIRELYLPVLTRLGWKARPDEPARVARFRPWLIQVLAFDGGDGKTLARAAALGRAYLGSDGKLHPEAVDRDLATVALQAAARQGDARLFDTILARLTVEDDTNVRDRLLTALGSFLDPALAERARELAFDDRLRVNERGIVLSTQLFVLELHPAAWGWLRAKFDAFAPRLPDSYVQFLVHAQDGCSEEDARELQEIFGPRVAAYSGGEYTLAKALESTRICAARVAAQRASTLAAFKLR